jgi:Uma2 family endonuclease
MGMPALQTDHPEWTAQLVRQLPEDGYRYEVIDGELVVSPSPGGRHQRACALLWRMLDTFATTHGLGAASLAPTDIEYSPQRLVQPDVFVMPLEDGQVAPDWDRLPQLLLVAEVLSPSTALHDRRTKRKMYLDEGVPQYWIVDLQARLIERWRPGDDRPELCDDVIEWHPAGHAPTLTIDVAAYFAAVHDIFPHALGW